MTLERAGIGALSSYVLYLMEDREAFVQWWISTNYGDEDRLGGQKPYDWESKTTSAKWHDFRQVAHQDTGLPKVVCKICGSVLEHPKWLPKKVGNGTSTLGRHLKSDRHQRCLDRSTQPKATQPGISHAFQELVKHLYLFAPDSLSNPWLFM